MDEELPCEPAGHGEIATESVSICSPFWRTFVRGSVVMQWIEYGYRLLWTVELARRLANLIGTVLSMYLSWGLVTQLLYSAFICLDLLGSVTQLLGDANGGSHE